MPVRTIRTARLALRPLSPADLDEIHALWTQPGVRRWLFDDITVSRETAGAMLHESARLFEDDGLGLWAVTSREGAPGSPMLGTTGFWHFGEPPTPEILYLLDDRCRGRGYATELARTMLHYAFEHLGFAVVRGSADHGNSASHAVMERAGMRFAGRRVRDGLDTVFYELPREGWVPDGTVFETEDAGGG